MTTYTTIIETTDYTVQQATNGNGYLLTRQGVTQGFDTLAELNNWLDWA